MKIQTPLQKIGVKLNDNNTITWQGLSTCERLFYKYIIEHDTTLSAMLIGIFSAYVVNIVSNLVTLEIENLSFAILYLFNLFFAVGALFSLMKLYPIHLLVEKRSEVDSVSVRVNKDFERLHQSSREIKVMVKRLKYFIIGIISTLLMCFMVSSKMIKLICSCVS